ncbi:MAG: hypothetical protein KC649_07990, partial [Candidatus Omnitrophica bacterium]|nr:hypothetical protein [Candidatus Omnitrophota bacterium]
ILSQPGFDQHPKHAAVTSFGGYLNERLQRRASELPGLIYEALTDAQDQTTVDQLQGYAVELEALRGQTTDATESAQSSRQTEGGQAVLSPQTPEAVESESQVVVEPVDSGPSTVDSSAAEIVEPVEPMDHGLPTVDSSGATEPPQPSNILDPALRVRFKESVQAGVIRGQVSANRMFLEKPNPLVGEFDQKIVLDTSEMPDGAFFVMPVSTPKDTVMPLVQAPDAVKRGRIAKIRRYVSQHTLDTQIMEHTDQVTALVKAGRAVKGEPKTRFEAIFDRGIELLLIPDASGKTVEQRMHETEVRYAGRHEEFEKTVRAVQDYNRWFLYYSSRFVDLTGRLKKKTGDNQQVDVEVLSEILTELARSEKTWPELQSE